MENIETDYFVIGTGAMGMAFADALFDLSDDAHITLVDRHHRPGGHWNDAYPFVRLHQPSAFYGLNAQPLGGDAIDTTGANQGLAEMATGQAVLDHFEQALRNDALTGEDEVRHLPHRRAQHRQLQPRDLARQLRRHLGVGQDLVEQESDDVDHMVIDVIGSLFEDRQGLCLCKGVGVLPEGDNGTPDRSFPASRISRTRPQTIRLGRIGPHPPPRIIAEGEFIHGRNMSALHAGLEHLDRLARRQHRLLLEQQSLIAQTQQRHPDILGLNIVVTRLRADVRDHALFLHQPGEEL